MTLPACTPQKPCKPCRMLAVPEDRLGHHRVWRDMRRDYHQRYGAASGDAAAPNGGAA